MSDQLKELSPEEAKGLTEEIQALLQKYNAELGTTSTITLFKRVAQSVSSPAEFLPDGEETGSDSETA